MKKNFTKSIYLIVVLMLLVSALPSWAQVFTKANVETGRLYTATAKDAAGNIYVIRTAFESSALYEVAKFVGGVEPGYTLYTGLTHQAGSFPWGLAVAPNNDVYLTTDFTTGKGAIIRLDAANAYAATTVQTGRYFSALAFDASGNLYAVEYNSGQSKSVVVKYATPATLNSTGTQIYAGLTTGPDHTYPTGLSVSPVSGNIYVTDAFSDNGITTDKGRIIKLDASAAFAATDFKTLDYATALTFDALGNLYASESPAGAGFVINRYPASGNAISTTGTLISSPLHSSGGFYFPWGIVVKDAFNIFAVDGDDGTSGGALLHLYGPPTTPTSAVNISNITAASARAGWSGDANGTSVAVFIAQANTGQPAVLNNTTYNASTVFSTGTGPDSWHCIYKGGAGANQVNVTGLLPATNYRVMAVTYNGPAGSENYLTSLGATNPVNFITNTTITSFTPTNNTITNAATINYTVLLGAPITGLGTPNFSLTTSGVSSATITGVTGVNPYNVAVSTGTGDGTIKLNFANTNGLTPSVSAIPYTTATAYTIDKTPPTIAIGAPSVTTITEGAGTVTYTVTYADANFSQSTLGTGDITLNKTGTANASIAVDGSSGTGRTVTLSNITGSGTLGINIAAGSARDLALQVAPAAGPSATFVVKGIPLITFNTLPAVTYGDDDFLPGATSDNTGVAIMYASDNESVATIADGSIHIVGAGTANITASQAGDDFHTAAVNKVQQLTVSPAPLTIKADDQVKIYGAAMPILTASYTGFVNGETAANLTTQPTLSTSATSSSHIAWSPYSITASGAVDANYAISYLPGSLTVTAAPLTITANNQTKVYGDPVPTLTASYTGLVNGDYSGSLTTLPTLSTTATQFSDPGEFYAITASGAVDPDYVISYVAGTLTITQSANATLTGISAGPVTLANSGSTYTGTVLTSVTSVNITPIIAPGATVKVNGTTVEPGSPSGNIDLVIGDNTIPVVVKAQNGTNTNSYNVIITRRETPGLANFVVSSDVNPAVPKKTVSGSNYVDYTATVPYLTSQVMITPTAAYDGLTIKVGDGTVPSGTASAPVDLQVGANIITTTVTDGITTNTYAITVTRAAADQATDAGLSGIAVNPRTPLTQVSGPATLNYTVQIPNSQSSLTVTTTFTEVNATMTVNGMPTLSGVASQPIPLSVGDNAIDVIVTAQDGANIKTYAIKATRAGSPIATLANLGLSTGILNPVFTAGTTGYTATVPNTISTITVTPTVTEANATVQVTGVTVASGTASADQPLTVGTNTITTVVTAQDGTTTQTYTVTVTRAVPDLSTDAGLSAIKLSPNTPLTTVSGPGTVNYTTAVPNSETSLTVTATVTEPHATIKVNGAAVSSATASTPIPLGIGDNVINIVVTAQDGATIKSYIITAKRAGTPIVTLASLVLSKGVLGPAFTSATGDYSATVPTATSAITVTPTVTDLNAAIQVNGVPVASGTASASIPLNPGPNTITTVVTARDGSISKTYTVTVTNATAGLSTNAGLAGLRLNPITTLTTVTGPGNSNYTAAIPNSQTSLTVVATTSEAHATMKVNGIAVTSGTASPTIPLNVGNNVITVVVTAQDGATTKNFIITANRAASALAALSNLAISTGTLSPVFATATTGYTAIVPNAVASLKITPTVTDATATIKVNGITVASGAASASLPLVAGANTITTVVTAQDGTTAKTYTVTITRAAAGLSTNAGLSNLKLNPNTALTTVTGPGNANYTTAVPFSESSLAVIATAAETHAIIKVNGTTATSGIASQSIPLSVGSNVINVIVTAQDGVTTRSYIITANRSAASLLAQYDAAADNLKADGITVHQGVSPNGDGDNDVLTIDGIAAYPDNSLLIMNRSGVLVFEAKGYNNTSVIFDGHSNKNGRLQQAGTYFYSLDYKDGDKTKHKTGFILLKY